MKYPLLSKIQEPADCKRLNEQELPVLAAEIRAFMLEQLDQCGGHLAAGLGTVELTIALHYLYHAPKDALVWDVGHQAYPHKILTGRKEKLDTIRQTEGLAPFPKREESPFDAFGVGHSSTSISAALGMAIANEQQDRDHKAVAIIGDGAMTAGMAFEALNHAGAIHADMLVILNDNDMSISNNVGALSNYFARIISGKVYTEMRQTSKKILGHFPPALELLKRTETHMKGMVAPGTLFEELGFNYVGPIDGHCLNTLLKTLRNLRSLKGPQFLHVVTKKGKGFAPAEAAPIQYHGVSPGFLGEKPKAVATTKKQPTYSQIFGNALCDLAEADQRVVGITPAMCEGSGMAEFAKRFPERFFDVAIAEQHAVTVAAGMACEGLKPIVAIYSSFLQRAYDQLIHDVALQNLPVLFAIDRAGLVGGDGSTHNGAFDLSFLRAIPNVSILCPADENELRHMLYTGLQHGSPVAVRYPRGTGPGVTPEQAFCELPWGRGEICRQGSDVALLAFGSMVTPALAVGETLGATVANMRFVKPLDEVLVLQLAQTHKLIVTIEENTLEGGAGSAVLECLHSQNNGCRVVRLGLPDNFIEHGKPQDLLHACGLDTEEILRTVEQALQQTLHKTKAAEG